MPRYQQSIRAWSASAPLQRLSGYSESDYDRFGPVKSRSANLRMEFQGYALADHDKWQHRFSRGLQGNHQLDRQRFAGPE
jgi:hypothetical protein